MYKAQCIFKYLLFTFMLSLEKPCINVSGLCCQGWVKLDVQLLKHHVASEREGTLNTSCVKC